MTLEVKTLVITSPSVSRLDLEEELSTTQAAQTRISTRKRKFPSTYQDYLMDSPVKSRLICAESPKPSRSCEAAAAAAEEEDVESSPVTGKAIIDFFEEKGLKYCALPQLKSSIVTKKLSKVWKENKHLFQYNFESAEVKRYCHCIKNMNDEATDEYASSIEIKYVNPEMGYGVFANRKFSKKEVIGVYSGVFGFKYSEKRLDEIKKAGEDPAEYLFEFPETVFDSFAIDGAKVGNFTRFINHADPASANISTVEFFYKGSCYVLFVADKAIGKGDQIFYDYGPSYWEKKQITPQ